MLGFISKTKVQKTGGKINENTIPNIYIRDFYIKDFKYISPEALQSIKEGKKLLEGTSRFRKWLEEMLKGLKQFFYGGSLHGVKYIFEPSFSVHERATWLLIVAASVLTSAITIIQLISKWSSTPFVNVIDSVPSPVWAMPFPTVVLCPHLHLKRQYHNVSQLNELEKFFATLVCPRMMGTKRMERRLDLEQMTSLLDFILKDHFGSVHRICMILFSLAIFSIGLREASYKASPTCGDVIKSCNWPALHAQEWEADSCCDLFQPIFTNYGLCYAFNTLPLNGMTNETLPWQKSFNKQASPAALQWGLDTGYPKTFPPDPTMTPLRVMSSGETNGLGLELYLNTSDHQFECDGNSLGFTMLISSPADHVYTSTVIRLPMGRMTTVEVYPLTYKTDSSLRSLSPAQRQCFFQNERKLEYFEFYTDSNCKHDMLVQEARNICACVLFNWPRKNERDPICSTNSEYECINKVKANVEGRLIYAYYAESDEQAAKDESQSCHPSCNDVIYSSQVFYSDLTKDLDSSRHWGHPKVGEVTQINVHLYDDMFLGQHRHAQYDQYYFVGAIGGLLSLFLGFSIISVAELVYFVILRPAYVIVKETYCKK